MSNGETNGSKSRNLPVIVKSPFPGFDPAKPDESIDAIKEWAVNKTKEEINWYDRKKRPKQMWSQWIRRLSITLGGLGTLCPLLEVAQSAVVENGVVVDSSFGDWGYIFIAIAGGLLTFDYYFGYSSGWIRYMLTQNSLENELQSFYFDWAMFICCKKRELEDKFACEALKLLKEHCSKVESLVQQETEAWANDFQNRISELEKKLKTESSAKAPGSIRVTIKNQDVFEDLQVFLNKEHKTNVSIGSEIVLENISPGPYVVDVTGKKDNKNYEGTTVAEVKPGEMAPADVNLKPKTTE